MYVHTYTLIHFIVRACYSVALISKLHKMIGLFCRTSSLDRTLLQKRPIISRSLLIVATPYGVTTMCRLPNISLLQENVRTSPILGRAFWHFFAFFGGLFSKKDMLTFLTLKAH